MLMRRSSFLFREGIQRGSSRPALLILLLLSSCLAILIAPRDISSHEPVTTKVMFNKEIVRIFQRHCLACHDSGSTTNISLATFAQARPWAKAFKEEVLERRMPPYQAVKGFGHFHNDYTLTQQEVDQIVSWVEGGVPQGEDKDLPPEARALSSWVLDPPALVLEPKPDVSISAGEGDEYRCIALPTNLTKARWVTAVDFHSGNDAAVHCAAFGIDLSAVRKTNDDSGCGAQNGAAVDNLGRWMPGQTVDRLPKNVARLLPAGARIILRIHYHKGSEEMKVRSSLALYFARGPAMKSLRTVALAAPQKDIPAGAERYRVKASYTIREAAEAIAIRPLLFPFAKSVEVTAHRPDGTIEVLIWSRDHRYDWQPEYAFKNPVSLPPGTRIEATAYLDNSDNNPSNPNSPARAIRFDSALCELSFINVQRETH
jgi:mono/diheme cytochrome c family protein